MLTMSDQSLCLQLIVDCAHIPVDLAPHKNLAK